MSGYAGESAATAAPETMIQELNYKMDRVNTLITELNDKAEHIITRNLGQRPSAAEENKIVVDAVGAVYHTGNLMAEAESLLDLLSEKLSTINSI